MDKLNKDKKIIIICIFLIILIFSILIIKKINTKDDIIAETDNYTYLKKYKSNEYVPLYVKEEDVVKKYLNDYRNNMLYDIEEAYNSLNVSYRSKRFKNLEGYREYVNNILSSSIYSLEVDKYSKSIIDGYKVFNVYDKSGKQYIIKEISIMNYEIYLDSNTVSIS